MQPKAEQEPLGTTLSEPFSLSEADKAQFRRDGHIKLKHVLSAEELKEYTDEFFRLVHAESADLPPLEERDTYGKAFLQVFNLWRKSDKAREFVFGQRLAQLAAELLGVKGVRLYHDQALFKEASGGVTPWHADQYYWPLESDRTITVWIPLQDTPLEMGPLAFCSESHERNFGRHLPITDESEEQISASVANSGLPIDEGPFELGDVSFHLGWTFHRAGQNRTGQTRGAMTIIYMDRDMTLAEPKNEAQQTDWGRWVPSAQIGAPITGPENPILYEQLSEGAAE